MPRRSAGKGQKGREALGEERAVTAAPRGSAGKAREALGEERAVTAAPRGSAGKAREPLDEERAVTAAFEVLDGEGLDGLTMRRIAARLAVQNPALYWHFENKQALVDRMAGRMLAGVVASVREAAAGPAAGWRDLLLASARAFRRVMRAHRDGARLVASADLSRSPMTAALATAFEALLSAGFPERDAFIGLVAVFDYTLGATYEEQEDPARAAAATPGAAAGAPDAWAAAVARLGTALGDGDTMFEGGLGLLLDGLAARRPGRRAPRAPLAGERARRA